MAQHSNSISETLDAAISLSDRSSSDHHQSSSSTTATTSPPSLSSLDPALARSGSFSRLNAKAPEFVPRSSSSTSMPRSVPPSQVQPPGLAFPGSNSGFHVPIHHHHHHYPNHVPVQHTHRHNHLPQYYGGFGDPPDLPVEGRQVQGRQQAQAEPDHVPPLKNGLSEEATQKIINQVEYYFSDLNLVTTDHLMKFISKDAEGYVPIAVVASFKKIKTLISSNNIQLASILRNSGKLVVSEDGKKVRRQHPLTELAMEELHSRIVVAENLPEDHCHQTLMKIFSTVGSVKTIRTCQPQTSNGGASSTSRSVKADSVLFSNKLHAFVEYESVELAEKAVAELNDEANWRSGLRVRLLPLRRAAKSSAPARGKKIGLEGDENDTSTSGQPQLNGKHLDDPSQRSDNTQSNEYTGEEQVNDREGGQKKGRSRGRGKGRGRAQFPNNNRGSHVGTTSPSSNSVNTELPTVAKQPPGPRMPDGTRGFSMGRGKPVDVSMG